MTSSERMEEIEKLAYPGGEIGRIVAVIRKIESVCGRVGVVVATREHIVAAQWTTNFLAFDVHFAVGAASQAAELISWRLRQPPTETGG